MLGITALIVIFVIEYNCWPRIDYVKESNSYLLWYTFKGKRKYLEI